MIFQSLQMKLKKIRKNKMDESFEEIKETEKLNKRLTKALGIALGFSFLIIVLEIVKNL